MLLIKYKFNNQLIINLLVIIVKIFNQNLLCLILILESILNLFFLQINLNLMDGIKLILCVLINMVYISSKSIIIDHSILLLINTIKLLLYILYILLYYLFNYIFYILYLNIIKYVLLITYILFIITIIRFQSDHLNIMNSKDIWLLLILIMRQYFQHYLDSLYFFTISYILIKKLIKIKKNNDNKNNL